MSFYRRFACVQHATSSTEDPGPAVNRTGSMLQRLLSGFNRDSDSQSSLNMSLAIANRMTTQRRKNKLTNLPTTRHTDRHANLPNDTVPDRFVGRHLTHAGSP
jgi:hypothetical protein